MSIFFQAYTTKILSTNFNTRNLEYQLFKNRFQIINEAIKNVTSFFHFSSAQLNGKP